MSASPRFPVFVVRDGSGESCGHQHRTVHRGAACLEAELDRAKRRRQFGRQVELVVIQANGHEHACMGGVVR